jgi:predicted nucleic acid-binding protein
MDYYAIKVHYFDASALVKLVADDPDEAPGRDVLRAYYRQYVHPGYTVSFCVAEALGALKLKYLREKISEAQYLKYVKDLIREVGNRFKIDELDTLLPVVSSEFERMVTQYKLDFVDCFQLATLKHGKYRIFDGPSKSVLITADRELAKAALKEGDRVWECTSEPPPAAS